MLGFPLGILSAAGAGGVVAGDYELISSTILTGSLSSITFSSLGTYSSTYKHLQVRYLARDSRAVNANAAFFRFNADSGSNYSYHQLLGDGSSVSSNASTSQTNGLFGVHIGANLTANSFGGVVADILDPYSTSKNTTTRSLSAAQGNSIRLISSAWYNTASITSLEIISDSGNFVSGSRFSLYGIR
jgi:hypothetical protein